MHRRSGGWVRFVGWARSVGWLRPAAWSGPGGWSRSGRWGVSGGWSGSGPRGWAGSGARSRGSVTAEFAVVMPVVALLVAAVVASAAAGITKLRCLDAARAAARLAARHEPEPVSLAAARSAGPNGAQVRLSRAGDLVRVRVTTRLRLPLPGRPTMELEGQASALVEPVWNEGLSSEGLPSEDGSNEGLSPGGSGPQAEGESR